MCDAAGQNVRKDGEIYEGAYTCPAEVLDKPHMISADRVRRWGETIT